MEYKNADHKSHHGDTHHNRNKDVADAVAGLLNGGLGLPGVLHQLDRSCQEGIFSYPRHLDPQ